MTAGGRTRARSWRALLAAALLCGPLAACAASAPTAAERAAESATAGADDRRSEADSDRAGASRRVCPPPPASTPTAPALELHNDVRADVTPAPPRPLPPLCWGEDLARDAKRWSRKCRYGHSGNAWGENIYTHSGDRRDEALALAMEFWAGEADGYDYEADTCSARTCGHYTQIVWRDTRRVGCHVALCEKNSPFGAASPEWTYVVCNYDPRGNYRGRRPW